MSQDPAIAFGDTRLPPRFWDKVEVNVWGCWIWRAAKTKGFGVYTVYIDKRHCALSSHRYLYETLVGPVSPGFECGHVCGVNSCCNPEHLRLMTRREIAQLVLVKLGLDHACKHGHAWTEENTIWGKRKDEGGALRRSCRTCRRRGDRARYERSRR